MCCRFTVLRCLKAEKFENIVCIINECGEIMARYIVILYSYLIILYIRDSGNGDSPHSRVTLFYIPLPRDRRP